VARALGVDWMQEAAELVDAGGGTEELAHRLARLVPVEIAKKRRRTGLQPVRIGGRREMGSRSGYFQTKLRDGSLGYFQRRFDDCLQAAIATCLQIPPHKVPDLHIEDQLAAGKEPDDVKQANREKMRRWLDGHGVTIVYHPTHLPTSGGRWIGVVRDTYSGYFADHCMVMSGHDALFDPSAHLPSEPLKYDIGDVDYGITIDRR